MKQLGKFLFFLIIFPAETFLLNAQELNAVVKVHSEGSGVTNRQIFASLEEALHTFINGRKWTDAQISTGKRVNCSFTLVITEALNSGSFRGELYVQSFRPVKNSDYISPMLNLRDTEMEFTYTAYQPLRFDPSFIQENLTATIAYYSYLVLALDFDSRSPMGGTTCFRSMEMIAANARSYGWKGWEQRSNRNRAAIATAFNDGTLEEYRRMWFDYHHEGLDVPDNGNGNGKNGHGLERVQQPVAIKGMAGLDYGEPGSGKVFPSIIFLSELQSKRPNNVLIRLFGDAKLEETVFLLSKADAHEKQQARDILLKLYPVRSAESERLR